MKRILLFIAYLIAISAQMFAQENQNEPIDTVIPIVRNLSSNITNSVSSDNFPGDVIVDGNMGIGISAPQERLHVNGAIRGGGLAGALKINTQSGWIDIGPQNSSFAHIYTDKPEFIFNKQIDLTTGELSSYNGPFYFKTNRFYTRMTILSTNGNVGIGTANPSQKLDVNGSLLLNGDIMAYNNKVRIRGIIHGQDMLMFQDEGRFTVTTSEIPDLRTPSFSMTQYGVAAPLTNGAADLWLAGNDNIRLFTAGEPIPRMTVARNGNMGIGTTNPIQKLDVRGNIYINSGVDENHIYWGSHNMVMGTPQGDYSHNVFSLQPGGATEGNLYSVFQMYNALSPSSHEMKIQLHTAGDSFFNSGNVGIGTITPGAKLDVVGTIRAHEVRVCLNQGCDFVFEPDYQLMPLGELDNFIKTNRHLPEVAPAAVMEVEGIDLSQMNAKLLQKVEELTLYMIELNKRIEELERCSNK